MKTHCRKATGTSLRVVARMQRQPATGLTFTKQFSYVPKQSSRIVAPMVDNKKYQLSHIGNASLTRVVVAREQRRQALGY